MAKKTAALRISIAIALAAAGGLALSGCTPAEPLKVSSMDARSSTAKPVAEDAAIFAEGYLKDIAEKSTEQKELPMTLTEAQFTQLMDDGRVDGISDGDLRAYIEVLYGNNPIGGLIYFPASTPLQDRLQTILLLTMSHAMNGGLLGSDNPIDPSQIALEEGEVPRAVLNSGGVPPLVFVEDNWWVDGPALLKGLQSGSIGPGRLTGPLGSTDTPAE